MQALRTVVHVIDTISEWSGKTASWLVVVLTVVLGCEIFMRYAMNAPTRWAFDLSYMIGGSFFMLGEAYTLKRHRHVSIDIFTSRLSYKQRASIDLVLYLVFFFPLWGGLLYVLIPYVWLSWKTGERSMQGYWMPILYPFKTVMPVAVFLFVLQGIAEFLRCAMTVLGRGEL